MFCLVRSFSLHTIVLPCSTFNSLIHTCTRSDLPPKSKRSSPVTSTSVCPALTASNGVTNSRPNGMLTVAADKCHTGINSTANPSTNRRNMHNMNNNSISAVASMNGSGRSDVPVATDSGDACTQIRDSSGFASSTLSDVFESGSRTDLSNTEFLQVRFTSNDFCV